MTTTIVAFLIALAVTLAATPLVRWLAPKLGAIDTPDGFRKVHVHPTPRLGGVAVYLGFLAPVIGLLYVMPDNYIARQLNSDMYRIAGLIVAATVALIVGALDDIRGMRPRWKFAGQLLVAGIACAAGLRIDVLSNPFASGHIHLGWLAIPVTLFWFVAAMNAVNLLDGLDGLAAGVCLFVVMALLVVSVMFHRAASMVMLASLGGALLGFLVYNFHPASIFLGDSGSLLLGFTVGALSTASSQKSETAVALIIPIIALGVPVFDTAITILRRWSRNLPIAAADRQHIHHRLLQLGLSQRNVVLILYGACILLGGAAVVVAVGNNEAMLIVLGALTVIAFVCVRVFGGVRLEDLLGRVAEDWRRREAAQTAYVAVAEALQRLNDAESIDKAWSVLSTSFAALGLDHVALDLRASQVDRELTWNRSDSDDHTHRHENLAPDSWAARFDLRSSECKLGELHVTRHVEHGRAFVREMPDLVQQLCRGLAEHLGKRRDEGGKQKAES